MLYNGASIKVIDLEDGIVELVFDLENEKINKFDKQTLSDQKKALGVLQNHKGLKGLLVTSLKDSFIVGADIKEFMSHFSKPRTELKKWLNDKNAVFNGYEDLNVPTVAAINGFAFGGGFEMALTTSYRVASEDSKMGLLESKLGLIPGWGGTVRLSRISGADNAIEWISSGKKYSAIEALNIGVVDSVVKNNNLKNSALILLKRAINGELDWKQRQNEKKNPLKLNDIESIMVFDVAKGFIASMSGPNYSAPVRSVEVIQKGRKLTRDEALKLETECFLDLAHSKTAKSLTQIFLGDQELKKIAAKIAKNAKEVKKGAILGAGAMGGGIAYQSAYKGIPVYLKDIDQGALDKGMETLGALFSKAKKRGKFTAEQMAHGYSLVRPVIDFDDANFKNTSVVIEAIVENEKIKNQVVKELEDKIDEDTVIASNTSTISITRLQKGLKRPENFCGMHFFNPVHRMPLVEIIRGKETSEETIKRAVSYTLKMGKTPVVVNDCAGFLVNRILFSYFYGFMKLLNDGVDFKRIDKVMEKFGWPMGPAYLLDVVGQDVAHHASSIMAKEFPDRMSYNKLTAYEIMYNEKRYGQKNGKGFYEYSLDKKGRPKKELNPAVYDLLKKQIIQTLDVTDEQIVERMMYPMIIEASMCLDESIVNTPTELDLSMIYGLGFPPFRGGLLRYADDIGLKTIVSNVKKYENLGKQYIPTKTMNSLALSNLSFYGGVK